MKEKEKDRFWMFDEFWESSFDISWNPQRYSNNNELVVSTEHFSMWFENYKDWSKWTDCDPVKCIQTRYKMCKDDSWRKRLIDVDFEMICPVKYVSEIRKCKDYEKCLIVALKRYPIDTLPKECGNMAPNIEKMQMAEGDTIPGAWPWNAGVYLKGKYESLEYTCGATLINHGWAMTSSECLRPLDKFGEMVPGNPIDTRKWGIYDDVEVVVNDNDRVVIEGKERTQKISHIVFHPNFLLDVAILKIDDEANVDPNTFFPCLSGFNPDISSTCYMVGWNKNKFQIPFYFWRLEFSEEANQFKPSIRHFKQKSTSILQQIKVSIADFEKCKKNYPFYHLNTNSHICTTTRSKKSCRGDSGGGVFCHNPKTRKWHLQGITNFVEYQGCEKNFEFFTKIDSILPFIKETIAADLVKMTK